jgi:hypothetical protein
MARPISCRTDAIAAHSLRKIGSLATVLQDIGPASTLSALDGRGRIWVALVGLFAAHGMAAVGATLSPRQVAAKVRLSTRLRRSGRSSAMAVKVANPVITRG